MFNEFVLDKATAWPAVPRVESAGDAQYALECSLRAKPQMGLRLSTPGSRGGDWKIQRNALGTILSRTKPGYLLYRDPSGQGWILEQLCIKEPCMGGSSYEKTSSWRYAKIRFQSCDRR
jgi:hypothetical protein